MQIDHSQLPLKLGEKPLWWEKFTSKINDVFLALQEHFHFNKKRTYLPKLVCTFGVEDGEGDCFQGKQTNNK